MDEPADEPEVAFAFSPALAVEGLLDYTKSEHSKIYKSAIREVCKEPFECEDEGLYQFLKDVQDRADEMGWSDSILNITLEVTENGDPVQERLCSSTTTERFRSSKSLYPNCSTSTKKDAKLKTPTCSTSVSWRLSRMPRRRESPCGRNSIGSVTTICAAVWLS
ncbi:hypothetical protein MHU86_12430 [Fragilaria crotonensis]|nr:hypothetical protein MHU86_12430 [Fragilaria crotonensis]